MSNNSTQITTEEHLSDEIKFLIACCQADPSVGDTEFICSYLNAERLTLNALIGLANQHGILPLVYLATKANTPVTINSQLSTLINELKAHYQTIAQRNMLMSAELIRILQLLDENGIEALAFKGPTLSQMAYGDITLRQYVDLDVLVKKEDIYKIDELLKDRGYQRVLEMTAVQEKVYMQYAHDLGLYHPKSGVHFEMHWSLMNEDYPMQVDLDTIWDDPQSVKINTKEIKTFPTEELLLYLCIHGSKHLWERIEWIKDIDLLIRTQEIDWEKVMQEAQESGFEKMTYLGLSLTAQLFNTPLPQKITEHITQLTTLDTLSDFVLKSWQEPPTIFQQTAAMLKLFLSTKEKLIYLNKILIKPSLNEYWAVDLPRGFYWVYYFVRPYMLMKKYLGTS